MQGSHHRWARCSPRPTDGALTGALFRRANTTRRASASIGSRMRRPRRYARARSSCANISTACARRSTCRSRPHGTPFQRRVWSEIAAIPFGETHHLRRARAHVRARRGSARAAGAATGRNPLSIIVPCHRVVGSDGSLTGYAGGLERKTRLLEIEDARTGLAGLRPQDLARLVALAAMWGASYLFMRYAVPHLGPVRADRAARGRSRARCSPLSSREPRLHRLAPPLARVPLRGRDRPRASLRADRAGAHVHRRVDRGDPQRALAALRLARRGGLDPRSAHAAPSWPASRSASRERRCWWAGRRRR